VSLAICAARICLRRPAVQRYAYPQALWPELKWRLKSAALLVFFSTLAKSNYFYHAHAGSKPNSDVVNITKCSMNVRKEQ